MKKPAALYLRSSKDRKDVSPDAQRRALAELAESRGEVVVQEFLDTVESGKDENRPAFQELIKAVRNPERGWDTLLIYDTARLARRRVISIIFEEVDCRRHGVTVVYKSLPDQDPLTEMLLKSILQAWDEYHSISSRDKGLAGMAENVRAGFRAGGRAPTGYRLKKVGVGALREGEEVTKSVLEPDPDRAPAVGSYLRARASGMTRPRAKEAAGLDDMRGSTLIGIEWNALVYAGHTVWNVHAEREGGGYVGGRKRRPRSEWVIQRDTHPPLISDSEAELLLGRLEAQAKARKKSAPQQRDRASDALLGGVLFGPGGQKWWAESDRYRFKGDGVQRSVTKAAIEGPVIDQVLAHLAAPEFAQVLLKATRKALDGETDAGALRKLRAEVSSLSTRISRTMELATELENPAPALRLVDDLERRRGERMMELREREAQAERTASIAQIDEDAVRPLLARLAEQARDPDAAEVRKALVSLIERIDLDPETLDGAVHYRVTVPPTSPDKAGGPARECSGPAAESRGLRWRPHGDSNPGRNRERVVS